MVEHDLISLRPSSEGVSGVEARSRNGNGTYRLRLEPDRSVHGSLAFRLVGNRTHGVFVCGINERSEQSKLLMDGDRIVQVGNNDVRRLTCDQIANILRFAMLRDGFAFIRVSQDRDVQVLLRAHSNVADDPFPAESCALKRCYSSLCTDPPLPLRMSTSDDTGFGDPDNQSAKIRPCRTPDDNMNNAEFVHLICFDELSETVTTHCKRKRSSHLHRASPTPWTYDEGLDQDRDVCNKRWRCSVCFELVRRRRWHMLKHEWTSGARRLLPRSASEFFEIEKHPNVHYALL